MSNPLVFIPVFQESLTHATRLTAVVVIVTLPWFRLSRPPWAVVAFLGYAWLSTAWSVTPIVTWHTTLLYAVMTLVAVVIASNVTSEVLGHGAALAGVATVAASYYALVHELPRAMPEGYEFMAGIGANRNILAYTLVLSLAFALGVVPSAWWARLVWATSVAVIALGIYLAESGTGYAAAFLLVVVRLTFPVTASLRGHRLWAVIVRTSIVLVLLIAALGAWQLNHISETVGRDTSLSGRVPFWRATIETLDGSIWFGNGWGAVWPHPWYIAPANPVFDRIVAAAGYFLTHGHNSVIDLVAEVGVVGTALWVLLVLTAVRASLQRLHHGAEWPDERMGGLTGLLAVLALLMLGVTEPLSTIPIGWWCLVVVAVRTPVGAITEGGLHRATRATPASAPSSH